jgi:integrase
MATIKKLDTAKGPRWRVQWWADGRRIEEWKSNEDQAKALKLTIEQAKLEGQPYDPRRSRQLLNDYFADWLPNRLVKGRPLTDATRIGYKKLWRRHITDTLGKKPMRNVSVEAVNRWHADLTRSKSRSEAAKAYRLVRAVMNTAVADEIIRNSPCKKRGAGQEHSDERPMVETSLVLQLADAIEPRYRAIVMLAGFGALRTGESLGLRRRDLNPMHATVDVFGQSQELYDPDVPEWERGQRFVDHTKSDAGRRTVAIPRVCVDALEKHLAEFVAVVPNDAAAHGAVVVFTSPEGAPLRRATLSAAWQAACKAAGAPEGLRLHDLRHHGATMAARMPGVTLKELMARIGHSSVVAALRYQHATAERDKAIASFLDDEIAAVQSHRRVDGGLAGR